MKSKSEEVDTPLAYRVSDFCKSRRAGKDKILRAAARRKN